MLGQREGFRMFSQADCFDAISFWGGPSLFHFLTPWIKYIQITIPFTCFYDGCPIRNIKGSIELCMLTAGSNTWWPCFCCGLHLLTVLVLEHHSLAHEFVKHEGSARKSPQILVLFHRRWCLKDFVHSCLCRHPSAEETEASFHGTRVVRRGCCCFLPVSEVSCRAVTGYRPNMWESYLCTATPGCFPQRDPARPQNAWGCQSFFPKWLIFVWSFQGCDWCTSHPVTAGTLVAWHQRTLGRFQSGGSFLSVSCQGHQTTTHSCPTWIYALLCVNFFPVLILQFGPKHAVLLVWKYLKAAVLSSSFNLFFQKEEKLLYFDLRGVDSCSSTCSYNQLGWRE